MLKPTSTSTPTSDRWQALPWNVGYLLLYLLLDWVSYIQPLQGFNITPWNPQPALAVALLLWSPTRLWLVWAGLLLAEVVVRGVPSDWGLVLIATLTLGWLYAAIARALVRFLDTTPALTTPRDLAWFTAVTGVGALLCGVAYVVIYAAPSLGSLHAVLGAIARYWIGDLVGLLVTLPILLIAIDPLRRRALAQATRHWGWVPVIGLTGLLLWGVLGQGGSAYPRFFYLLFIPVALASALRGMLGAVFSAALTQLGLIITVQGFPQPELTVFELQLLMAAITMTGLLVGVLVDDRARTAEALRDSLRLAAAGQMAAALAHELSQPLTALSNYAQACRMLVVGKADLPVERRVQLDAVAQHIVADANRASQVIKRLRDFFRTGALQLEACTIPILLETAIAGQRQRAAMTRIDLRTRLADTLPRVWMDPVQMDIVLRNLLDNALYAAAQKGGSGGWVEVRVERHQNTLLIEVLDSGPGLEDSRLATLFEPGASDKPGGMGIGLGICRSIVEAHGGRLWALADGHGHFCVTLPLRERDN